MSEMIDKQNNQKGKKLKHSYLILNIFKGLQDLQAKHDTDFASLDADFKAVVLKAVSLDYSDCALSKQNDIASAINFCLETKTPVANIVKKGLKKFNFGHERVKEAIESAGRQEINKLEKLFKYLLFSKILSHGQLGRFRHLAAAL